MSPHILIIEDDRDIASMLAHALRPLNYPIELAANGAEGLTLLHMLHPTIVVLDLHLPYISGAEILQTIRHDPALQQAKVIIFSAYAMDELLLDQADVVFCKPHALVDLREAVKQLVA